MKICNYFNSNFIKLLALVHVAVALFSYYYFFFLYNRLYVRLVEVNNKPTQSEYDFFYFVQTWPGSFEQPKRVGADFTIHGLWPTNEGGEPPPKFCDPNNPLIIKNIKNLTQALSTEWKALNQNFETDQDFWKYQWEKHGTCSECVLNQFEYFNKSLDLKRKTDILRTLQNASITPDAKGTYSLTKIRDSLKKDGYAPRIVCNRKGSDFQIFEIRYCVNRQGSRFQRCTKENINCTKNQVKFPLYTTTNGMNYSLKDESPLQQVIHYYYNETLE